MAQEITVTVTQDCILHAENTGKEEEVMYKPKVPMSYRSPCKLTNSLF